jgi:hypothetical protein
MVTDFGNVLASGSTFFLTALRNVRDLLTDVLHYVDVHISLLPRETTPEVCLATVNGVSS